MCLADVFKRIGLAERTGRGVDLIYQGLLRYGRSPPSYARSDATSVVVELSCAEANLDFLRLVLEEEQRLGGPMPIDALLVLSRLGRARRIDVADVAAEIQKDTAMARCVLERRHVVELCRLSPDQASRLLKHMVKSGVLIRHGQRKGAHYELAQRI